MPTGLVAENESDYPKLIERLVESASQRQQLGKAAALRAREHFEPITNSKELHRLCEAAAALPPRERDPLPGASQPPAHGFIQSLGEFAEPFSISLEGAPPHHHQALARAEASIAGSSAVLAHGEGGVVHYRNTYPDDPHLRLWSALIARQAGNEAVADSDLEFAIEHGAPSPSTGREDATP